MVPGVEMKSSDKPDHRVTATEEDSPNFQIVVCPGNSRQWWRLQLVQWCFGLVLSISTLNQQSAGFPIVHLQAALIKHLVGSLLSGVCWVSCHTPKTSTLLDVCEALHSSTILALQPFNLGSKSLFIGQNECEHFDMSALQLYVGVCVRA